jgi:hypothetical protein
MTVVGEPWACRAKAAQHESDMGRWNEIVISGRKGTSMMIITAYRVCKNSAATAGPTTSYAQQWHILRRSGDKTPDPRKRFIKDLEKRVRTASNEKQGIIVMLDANESLQHFNNDFTKWVRESGLVDIHVHVRRIADGTDIPMQDISAKVGCKKHETCVRHGRHVP